MAVSIVETCESQLMYVVVHLEDKNTEVLLDCILQGIL